MAKFDEVIRYFSEKKEQRLTVHFESLFEKNKKTGKKIPVVMKPINLLQKLEEERSITKLETGTLIDELLGGGLEPASTMLLYGPFGSGKTQTCFTMACLCPDAVIYIDTEGSFKAERIVEIAESRNLDWKDILENKISLFQPKNWIEQMWVLDNLPSPADVGKIGLIIADSISKEFRGTEFAGRQSLTVKQPLVREYVLSLENIAEAYGSAVIFTTQVYEDPNSNPFLPQWVSYKAIGGSSVYHQPDYVVFFRRGAGNVRIARMVDSSWQPLRERPFIITKRGIEDIPQTPKGIKLVEKTEKFEKKIETTLAEGKRGKKKSGDETEDKSE